MIVKSPAIEDIKTGLVKDPFDKNADKPTYHGINKLQKQCIRNITALESPLGGDNNGLAGLAKFPQ
eukprot:469005-Ditylum_brightwellii.AAC.1